MLRNYPQVNRKDASAAAITASALLELSTYINNSDSASFYRNKAVEMLQILSSPAYQARNKKGAFLLPIRLGT